MNRSIRRWRDWLSLLALLSTGCATPARVYVPPTAEGNSCIRECMIVYNTCRSGGGGGFYGGVGGGYYGGTGYYGGGAYPGYSGGGGSCSFQHADCLKTCPGAQVNPKVPPGPITNAGIRYSDTRLSLSYLPAIPLSGDALRRSRTGHYLGLEVSSGDDVRYHVAAYYGNLDGTSLVRFEPAALGFPIALHQGSRLRLELEPVVSLLDAELLFPSGSNILSLGSDVRLQLNFVINRIYLAVVPLAIQARYFDYRSAPGISESTTDFALDYRPQIFAGLTF